jgi:hypothetical protein
VLNPHIAAFVLTRIDEAAKFVTQNMPLSVKTDEAYEAFLENANYDTSAMVAAFAEACKFLPPHAAYKRRTLKLGDGTTAGLDIRFQSTMKWSTFLFPDDNSELTPESNLHRIMSLPLKVAQDWAMLRYVWNYMSKEEDKITPHIIGHFFPWAKSVVCDFPFDRLDRLPIRDPSYIKQGIRDQMRREVAAIMSGKPPNFFPTKAPALTAVMRSGNTLFAQYRMLKAAAPNIDASERAIITVAIDNQLVPAWVEHELKDMQEQWHLDRQRMLDRALKRSLAKYDPEFTQ